MLLVVCIRLYVANVVHLVHALQYASAVHIAHAVFFCTCCGLLLYIVLCFAVCNVEHLVHVAWIVHWINISTCGQYLYICYMFVLSLHSGMCGQCWNRHLSLVHLACCVHSVVCCKCCPSRTCPSTCKCGPHCTCGLFLCMLLFIVVQHSVLAVCNILHWVRVVWIVHLINWSTWGPCLRMCYMFALSLHSGICGQCWNMHSSLVNVARCVHSVVCCKFCPSRTCPSICKCGPHCTCGLFLYMLRSIVVHRFVFCRL